MTLIYLMLRWSKPNHSESCRQNNRIGRTTGLKSHSLSDAKWRCLVHIQSNQIIAGQPALQIRDLLLYASRHWDELRLEDIQGVLDVDSATAQQIINDLEAQGYIELNESRGKANNEERSWRNTLQGNALAFASARPPVKRAT